MKISRNYMKGKEFLSRQAWLNLSDVFADVMEVTADFHSQCKSALKVRLTEFRQWLAVYSRSSKLKKSVNKGMWLWLELISVQQQFNLE